MFVETIDKQYIDLRIVKAINQIYKFCFVRMRISFKALYQYTRLWKGRQTVDDNASRDY